MRSKPRGPVRWSAFVLLAGLVCAVAGSLAALGAVDPGWAAAAATAGTASLLAIGALRNARMRHAKLSAEITVLSERLLRLESGVGSGRAPLPEEALATGMAQDVELLSRLLGEVAEAVGEQGRAIAALETQGAASEPGQVPAEPQPAPVEASRLPASSGPVHPVPRLTSREDFAWAATAIMRKLGPGGGEEAVAHDAPADLVALRALDEGRLDLHLQAVVTLPQRRTRFYEALCRLRTPDGSLLMPDEFLPVIARHGALARLDEVALERALAVSRYLAQRDSGASVSCNVARHSLTDAKFLDGWHARAAGEPEAARRIILEVADLAVLSAEEAAGVARLRASGASLAFDAVDDLDQDWAGLARRGVRFAKADLGILFGPRHRMGLAGIVQTLARTGIQLVATGIDEESRVPDLLDYDVPLAQGSAIAIPRPVRQDVVAQAAGGSPETVAAPPSGTEPGAAPFREFLRRVG